MKIIWCKCLLSGSATDLFSIFFLIIEKKHSYAGYHRRQATKYGETFSAEFARSIKKYPIINEIK